MPSELLIQLPASLRVYDYQAWALSSLRVDSTAAQFEGPGTLPDKYESSAGEL